MLWDEVAPFTAGSATPARRWTARAACCRLGWLSCLNCPETGRPQSPFREGALPVSQAAPSCLPDLPLHSFQARFSQAQLVVVPTEWPPLLLSLTGSPMAVAAFMDSSAGPSFPRAQSEGCGASFPLFSSKPSCCVTGERRKVPSTGRSPRDSLPCRKQGGGTRCLLKASTFPTALLESS